MPIPPISITAFGGEVPAVDDRLLGDNNASYASNAWLLSGRIEPIRSLLKLHDMVNPTARSWFRYPTVNADIDHMADAKWLEFENENVRVVRSPVVGQDDDGRYYWADGVAPMMMTGSMIEAGSAPYKLGIPAPTVAPGVVASGGVSGTNKTVSYAYTWVSGLGEEGQPSPPTTLTGKLDDAYTVTMTAPSPADTTGRNLTNTRIYRTITSAQGVATFFFVAEVPIATLVYVDDCALFPDSIIAQNEQLQSATWSGPPADLQGLVTMANGMVAGWRNNEVWFCEPYYPHAWPVQYVLAVDPIIVGLGVYNQSVIILCDGQPYSSTGIHPSAMSTSKIQPLESCTSRRSIVNTPNGVLYSSPNGLIVITPAGATNLTANTILKSQWSDRVYLPTLMGAVISDMYYCYSGSQAGVFQADTFQNDTFQMTSAYGLLPGALISLKDGTRLGTVKLDPELNEVHNIISDVFNGETMILRGGTVYYVDVRKKAPYAKYVWRSKIFVLPYLQNLGAAKVYWTPADDTASSPSYFRVYASDAATATDDGLKKRFEQQMTKSGQMFRLPSGFKANYYQFEVEGYVIVDAIHCAQTPHELRAV